MGAVDDRKNPDNIPLYAINDPIIADAQASAAFERLTQRLAEQIWSTEELSLYRSSNLFKPKGIESRYVIRNKAMVC